jgi:hypothetical protein
MKTITVTRRPAMRANVLLVLQDATTGKVIKTVHAKNLVTNDGAEYYAELGANETPTYTFYAGKLALASSYLANETATATLGFLTFSTLSGIQDFDGTYPQTDDQDSDNTQAGVRVVTYRRTYTTSQANFTIKALAIVRQGYSTDPSTAASLRVILNFLTLPTAQQITKTSSQILKAFVNHAFAGS